MRSVVVAEQSADPRTARVAELRVALCAATNRRRSRSTMAGLADFGSNPDVDLLYELNGLARAAPPWVDEIVGFMGEFGLLFTLLGLVVWCWRGVRRRGGEEAAPTVAALVWAPLAAGVSVLVNVPIRGFVERRRPFYDHEGLEVLVEGKADFSFVSDHAALTMALAVGLFLASRRLGFAALVIGVLGGFVRVYMGVHYPTDVVGGLALGTAVALLLSPPAMALLTPLMRAVERSRRGAWLVKGRQARTRVVAGEAWSPESGGRDLAA